MIVNRLWILPVLAAMLMACSGPAPEEVPWPEFTGDASVENFLIVSPDLFPLNSIEVNVLESAVIVRASLLSKTGVVRSWLDSHPDDRTGVPATFWMALLKVRFRVHEYLKGSGPNEIVALTAHTTIYETEAAAQATAAILPAAHNSQWDDREAILLLFSPEYNANSHPVSLEDGEFWFTTGKSTFIYDDERQLVGDGYTLATMASKRWLPQLLTGSTSGRARSSTEKRFLLDVPSTSTSASTGRSVSVVETGPTITVAEMKDLITRLEAKAIAGGTPEYRTCVEMSYRMRDAFRHDVARNGGKPLKLHTVSISSGLPAGTVVYAHKTHARYTDPPEKATGWTEGPDAELFALNDLDDFVRGLPNIRYTRQVVTARPLPVGDYEVQPRWGWLGLELCNGYPKVFEGLEVIDLTVTQDSPHVLHEALFDPVAIGDAVGADGSNGVLGPNAFSLNGATTTITSLNWENNAVTLGASPTSTLADYAFDFIDVTGTTTLSLSSDNASTTPLTWTVPDKPWADGDLLMLRIRELPPPNPVTVTLTPRPQGSRTFFNVTVSWDDPQTCDGRYFVYVGTERSVVRNMGFHEPTVSSVTSSTGWLYNDVPDFWAVVRCDPSDYGASREVGRVSLRAAVE